MNFPQAVISGFQNYANSSGRASRSEYWYWGLFCALVEFVSRVLDKAIFHVPMADGLFQPAHPIFLIVKIALFLPSLAITVRRLHDVDRSGWWLFISLTIIG